MESARGTRLALRTLTSGRARVASTEAKEPLYFVSEAREELGSAQLQRNSSLFPSPVGTRLLSLRLLSPLSGEVIKCPSLDIQAGLEQPVEVATSQGERNKPALGFA